MAPRRTDDQPRTVVRGPKHSCLADYLGHHAAGVAGGACARLDVAFAWAGRQPCAGRYLKQAAEADGAAVPEAEADKRVGRAGCC